MDRANERCILDLCGHSYFKNKNQRRNLPPEHLEYLGLDPPRAGFNVCQSCRQKVKRQYDKSCAPKLHDKIDKLQDQLLATEDKLEVVRAQKDGMKKTKENRGKKIEELKTENIDLKAENERLRSRSSRTIIKPTRETAGSKGTLASSYILGCDKIMIDSHTRPNMIKITLETILASEYFLKNPPSKEDLKIAGKDSHYNVELLCDAVRLIIEKKMITAYRGWVKMHWDFSTERSRKMLPILLDLNIFEKAYLLPIINTADKTGASVAAAINHCVSSSFS